MDKNEYLYKFYSVNEDNLGALSCSSLWFAVAYHFNDPFEGALKPELSVFTEEKVVKLLKQIQELVNKGILSENNVLGIKKESMIDFEKKLLKNVVQNRDRVFKLAIAFFYEIFEDTRNRLLEENGMCSFSATRKALEPIDNILMWSHYGDGFKGFCIKFDKQKLIDSIPSKLFVAEKTMEYLDSPPIMDIHDFTNESLKAFTEDIKSNSKAFDWIFTKHSSWDYESEVRCLVEEGGLIEFDSRSIKEVYLGGKMPNDKKQLVASVLNSLSPNIPILESIMKPNSFDFEHCPVQKNESV